MSSMPECRKCETYVHSGPCLCMQCAVTLERELKQLRAENARLTAEVEAAAGLIAVSIVPKVKRYNCWFCGVTLTKNEHLPTCEYATKKATYARFRAARLTPVTDAGRDATA